MSKDNGHDLVGTDKVAFGQWKSACSCGWTTKAWTEALALQAYDAHKKGKV